MSMPGGATASGVGSAGQDPESQYGQDRVKVFSHEGEVGNSSEHLNSMDLDDIKTELEKDAEKDEGPKNSSSSANTKAVVQNTIVTSATTPQAPGLRPMMVYTNGTGVPFMMPGSFTAGTPLYPMATGLRPIKVEADWSRVSQGGISIPTYGYPAAAAGFVPVDQSGLRQAATAYPFMISGQYLAQMPYTQQQQQVSALGNPVAPNAAVQPTSGLVAPQVKEKRPHIKKPLNAFMLFMKEKRADVIKECTLKESAAINQILGKMWHALDRSEQAKYYEMAREERARHMQMYPGWSARDNYAIHKRRKKKKVKPGNPAQTTTTTINNNQPNTTTGANGSSVVMATTPTTPTSGAVGGGGVLAPPMTSEVDEDEDDIINNIGSANNSAGASMMQSMAMQGSANGRSSFAGDAARSVMANGTTTCSSNASSALGGGGGGGAVNLNVLSAAPGNNAINPVTLQSDANPLLAPPTLGVLPPSLLPPPSSSSSLPLPPPSSSSPPPPHPSTTSTPPSINPSSSSSLAGDRKCRARYGMEQQHMWCGPCRRKKKCVRYSDGDEDCFIGGGGGGEVECVRVKEERVDGEEEREGGGGGGCGRLSVEDGLLSEGGYPSHLALTNQNTVNLLDATPTSIIST